MPTDNLIADFEAYSGWRTGVSQSIGTFQKWLGEQDLGDAQIDMRIQHLIDRLREDKLNVAFVAEFSRGKSELINAIFFSNYGQRILPSSAGRTTMCPTELMYDPSRPPSIQLLPIETRATDTTTSEYKRYPEEWTVIPLDVDSAEAMQAAFQQVGETRRVTIEEATRFGLYHAENPDDQLAVGKDGEIDIPCWRHAIINFPHPLLKQGLVILDTPGLNAIGTEPELTLNLLPNAHAILFILAADTGVTKSDIDVWRNHIGNQSARSRGRVVVLNKIDGLWDPLKTDAEIDAEINKQIRTSADMLNLKISQVFPVSAQKALVAKINEDRALLEKSQIGKLERALSDELIPSKQDIVRDSTQNEIEDIVSGVRQILNSRKSGIVEQLQELKSLRGKNQDVIEHMMDKVKQEKEHFERGLQRFQALRSVFSQQTNILFGFLGMDNLRAEINKIREQMEGSMFSAGLTDAMNQFFKETNGSIAQSAEQIAEIQSMMSGMYKKFSEEHGLSQVSPAPFSTLKYHKEIARLERSYKEHFNTLGNIISTGKNTLTRKFFETIASRVVYVFEVANRDVENWLKTIMSPMETQVREHQLQLRRRLESVKRIHRATDTLEDRIAELEQMETKVNDQLAQLEDYMKLAYQTLNDDSLNGRFSANAA
ncbi:putative GTPase [Chitinivorax tropicus]|uniref:Putative GTPase n=1 Tax=Chitinivorax tropicus TaxID=714531 RepID=A0A840MQG5_9PROT|nr:dynamin family protein [Chitinivorax tropicus]MBB5018413.1 putative GTPase [Chitinivorax tropicus]